MSEYTLYEYKLSGLTTLDDEGFPYGEKIRTDNQYAYILELHLFPLNHPYSLQPGNYWNGNIVSAVSYTPNNIIYLLTLGYQYLRRRKNDIYIFCKDLCPNRIGVIRIDREIMEMLPAHPAGEQSWGHPGFGLGNTCDSIWADISNKRPTSPQRTYPKELKDLFYVKDVLPEDACFGISANVIKSFASPKEDEVIYF